MIAMLLCVPVFEPLRFFALAVSSMPAKNDVQKDSKRIAMLAAQNSTNSGFPQQTNGLPPQRCGIWWRLSRGRCRRGSRGVYDNWLSDERGIICALNQTHPRLAKEVEEAVAKRSGFLFWALGTDNVNRLRCGFPVGPFLQAVGGLGGITVGIPQRNRPIAHITSQLVAGLAGSPMHLLNPGCRNGEVEMASAENLVAEGALEQLK